MYPKIIIIMLTAKRSHFCYCNAEFLMLPPVHAKSLSDTQFQHILNLDAVEF